MAAPRPKPLPNPTPSSGTQPIASRTRRCSARTPLRIAVGIITHSGEVRATTRNVGIGGMFVETSQRLGYGARIEIRTDGGVFPAIVRWCETDGVAVQFELLGAEATHHLIALVRGSSR